MSFTMNYRIRHCVSCPVCFTRYLIGFSPYANGSYIVSSGVGSFEEYTLYCSCRGWPTSSRWSDNDIRTCAVSYSAYQRGYGSPREIRFTDQEADASDVMFERVSNAHDIGLGRNGRKGIV